MSQSAEPGEGRRHRGWIALGAVLGAVLLLIGGCRAWFEIATAQHKERLLSDAHTMLAGTPLADRPVEQLPGGGYTSGSILCMDNCLDLMVDAPAQYATDIGHNVDRAGWSVDIPDCFTNPDREGPPCLITNEEGDGIAIVGFEGSVFYLLVY